MKKFVFWVAFLVISSAAFADEAWVLWTKNSQIFYHEEVKNFTSEEHWKLNQAYTSNAGCEDARIRLWKVYVKEVEPKRHPGIDKVDKVYPSLVITNFKGSLDAESKELYCLPATIDPRGPKK